SPETLIFLPMKSTLLLIFSVLYGSRCLRARNASFGSKVILMALFLVVGDRDISARAETFPSRQVTIISPYQAGGTSDIIARLLARKLGDLWHQTVIVENPPGANGGIGIKAVTHAPAGGDTLLAAA